MLHASLIDNLKSVDPDRYRASLFAEKEERFRLATLYAFHPELAKVPELVSEPMIGAIRYQWWRDALEEIYSDKVVRQHEVTTPLAAVLQNSNISRFWVDRLIDGRERDLNPIPFEDMDAAIAYCRDTSGVLVQIAAMALDENADEEAIKIAGEAWGLTGLARAWGYYHKTMLSNLQFAEICELARSKYYQSSQSLGPVSSKQMPALAYLSLIPGYLSQMGQVGFDPTRDKAHYPTYKKQFRLILSVMRGRI